MTDPRMTPTNDAPVTVEQCPFCGGRAQLDRYDPDPANPEMAVNCMGECDGIFIFPKIAAGDTIALVQRWNTRLAALASAPVEPLPDIGPDPFKGPREDDRYEGSRLRLRAAYVQQQKGVPDQTALVWRYDLGTVLEMAIRLKSILADDEEPASAPAGDGVEEAAKPWADYHGPLPDFDHPLRAVFESGVQYAVELLAKTLGVDEYTPCDGTEEYDGDLGGTMMNIVLEAMPKDDDGDPIWPRDLAAALARPRAAEPTVADMAAFGASDAACILYPREDQQAERAAFCEGAAHAVSSPRAAVGEQQVLDELIRQFGRDGIPLTQEIYAPVSRAFLALQPPPAKVEGQCPLSPDGRHQVDTSMESGPNNCFHCEAPMS